MDAAPWCDETLMCPVFGSETVLVVDRDGDVRECVRRVLGGLGYRVEAAAHPDEALELARELDAVDLVLTAMQHPGRTGADVARDVARVRRGAAVLYLSDQPEGDPTLYDLLEPGAPFLLKPFTAEALSLRVRAILDRR